MKRCILFIIAVVLALSGIQTANAQQTQDALYIYRNDGGFNAFYYSDIDRIVYSKTDTLGVEQDDYVVQEIYALDTLYRIPISAIDSVTFVTPETVYKKDVVHTTESELWDYVVGSDSITMLLLSVNTPTTLVPKVGDKIVTTKSRQFLPGGFYGRVLSVQSGADGITVNCETPDLTELFDEFVCKAAFRSVSSDAARDMKRGSEDAYEGEIDLPGASYDIDLTKMDNYPYALSDQWSVKGSGQMNMGISNTLRVRLFLAIRSTLGINYDCITRLETSSWFDLKASGEISGQFDAALPSLKGWRWIPDTPFAVEWEGGFSASVGGKVELDVHRKLVTSVYQMVQYNYNWYDDEYSQTAESFHVVGTESKTSFTGEASISVGPYFGVYLCLLKKELGKAGFRFDAGMKATVKAELSLTDYLLATIPGALPVYMMVDPTPMYDMLNRDGSLSYGPFFKCDFEAQLFDYKNWKYAKTLVDEGTLAWITGYDMGLKFDGGLVPQFKNTKVTFDEKMVPTASVSLRRPALFYPPVGFAAYYTKSGKQLGKTLWYTDKYKESEMNSYEMVLPKFGGGKEVTVYPTVKLLRLYELLASPYASYTVPAEMTVKPESVETDCEPTEERFTVTDNLDRNEDKYERDVTIEFGEDVKPWFEGRWEGDDYIIKINKNDSIADRTAGITFTTFNEDESIKLEQTVTVTQEAPESQFSVKPDKIEVPGYSKDFQSGQLIQKLTIVYPNTANVKFTSSDEKWLKMDSDWGEKNDDGLNITATRNILIQLNPSLEDQREGTITVEVALDDGSTETKTVTVSQSALNMKLELEPEDVTLSAQEKAGASYSETQRVSINRDPYDEHVAKAVKSEEAKASEDWLEATVKDDKIEIRAKANPDEEERSANVTYTITMSDGSSMSRTIKVNQQKYVFIPPFTTSPENIRFNANGGELTITLVGDEVDRVKEVDFHSLKWVGGGGMNKSVTIMAQPNPDTEERVGNLDIYAYMTDGSVGHISKLIYQDGKEESTDPDNPKPDGDESPFNYINIVAKAYTNMSSSTGETYEDQNPMETTGAFSFRPENSSFTVKEEGSIIHIECSGHQDGVTTGSKGTDATLSFDIDKTTKKVKNLQYTQESHNVMGTFMPTPEGIVDIDIITEGHMRFGLGDFPIQSFSTTYKQAKSTLAEGLTYSSYNNYADVTGLYSDGTPSTKYQTYYEYTNDPRNSVELVISAKDSPLALEWPSEAVMKSLKDGGMPVNEGSTPPTTNGTYLLSPLSIMADPWGAGEELAGVSGMVVKFSDQKDDKLQFDYYMIADGEALEASQADPGLIQGNSDAFSICVPYESEGGMAAMIVSGNIKDGEVQNLHFAFTLMDEPNKYTILKDDDGNSETTTWAPATD